ncbi:ankyrin repeat and fibronectin type-III domain-containing protein 1 isoform X2 [Tribolium castaneum]|uniref:ankyrin repeat and fibronectin type-III domain-containing protein 1 isoform X2 n=1 Tax=Tribolium castaneum TaxID=7070 RepID=UPI0030FEBC55
MEEKKQYSALTIDRAAFLLLRVKKAFKKKKLQKKERERSAQLATSRIDQRASCAGLEGAARTGRKPPPLLRSRTLPAIVVPGVNILQAQLGNCSPDVTGPSRGGLSSRFLSARVSFSRDDTVALDMRRKSAVSRLCSSGNYGPERGADGTLLLRVPAPHVVAAQAYRISSPSSSSTALYRLGKLLNQGGSKNQIVVDDANVTRRLSWERRDTLHSRLPRSSSIDSMVEAVWAEEAAAEPVAAAEKRPSLRADRPLAIVSPSVGRRMKGQRGINELPPVPSDSEMEVASLPTNLPPIGHKPSKKEAKLMQQRLERLAKVNIHLHALFAAVEHGHLEKARTILESTDVDVNSLNNDGLSPLDVAVLSNNRPLVKMLVGFGAKEGHRFSNPDKLGSHLKQLLGEAEMRLQELGGLLEEPCGAPLNTRASFSSIIGNAYPTSAMTGCAGGDNDKQAIAWGRRAKTLKRLVLGFAQARPPDPPSLVALDITSLSSVAMRLQEPTTNDSPITTKFKVQWSTRPDFSIISGEKELLDMSKTSCTIELTQGRRYYFRAACGNLKGYGTFLTSTPSSVVPSSWREVDNKKSRFDGRLRQLEHLMEEVRQVRPGSEILETPNPQRRTQRKKTTIKQLFTAASKFQKNLRRGIYLACILYHEDKVLVTNEDFLPVIEIDETFPSCIHTDLHWLMKVSCSWDDTKSLRSDMEKNASSAIHFRTKLLSAVLQMQSSLCLQDLGQLYYRPLRDSQGTVVLSTVNYVKTPKSVSVLNSRWLPMNKVFKKMVLGDDHSISEVLMASIQEQINYHQVSSLKLTKGLYLAYLKMQSSVDLIQVVVSAKSPNMLPHCKIRDNPHVSADEWEYLKQQHLPDLTDNATEQQRTFLELVTSAAKRLFNYMDISSEEASSHRLYDTEVIDLTDEVSFIVVCPSAEFSCSVPGQREILLQRGDLLSLPIQVFEMIHLNTYQNSIIKKYSKLSCLLELDAATANHLHREAFSNSEVAIAKERLTRLQDLQSKLNQIWKTVRWLMDVITFARDRITCGISMRYILDKEIGCSSPKRSLLQIPPRDSKVVKSTPGRGSWPGPGSTTAMINPPNSLMNEFSKSEQHLSTNEASSQYLSACSDTESRKNSDSYNSDFFTERLPPSRSEDMLFAIPTTSSHRCRASTISSVSATTSPLLSVRPLYGGSMISVNTINTTNTSDSLHSLSSDSEGNPITSTPHKIKSRPKMVPSRSMTNVKQNILEVSTKSERYRPKHLNLEPNLESGLSKSLSNLMSTTTVKPDPDPLFKVPSTSTKELQSGILQVFAAYETGLASGTSLKLHVTPRTTAREVVDLVVKQLNMAVVLKGKDGPIYPADKLKNFCLVAVIGARERCLRDDFKPLQLQNPWKKGRLYVRQKHDVLAALEHSSKHSAII